MEAREPDELLQICSFKRTDKKIIPNTRIKTDKYVHFAY